MGKQKLKDLVKQLNADNAPPDGWRPEDQVAAASADDKPEAGKVYALTGGPGSRCIANGNSWKESEVDQELAAGDAGKER
jgi:hypothetical protein|tara:strand:- start:681 stop:920 length:240 start_codon:yes stop_codon:yes gene_type:complete